MRTLLVLSIAALTGCGPRLDSEKFDVDVAPARVTLQRGSSQRVTVTVTRRGGFTGAVRLEPPQGRPAFTTTIEPNPIPPGESSSTVTFTLPSEAPDFSHGQNVDLHAWDDGRNATGADWAAVLVHLWIEYEG